MADYRELLRDKAFETVAGASYNDLRRRRYPSVGEAGAPLFYEVTVPATGLWEAFRDATFPPFVRWLESQKLDPESARGVVVAAFLGDRCHLLEGERFLEVLRDMESLTSSALHFRVLRWLSD